MVGKKYLAGDFHREVSRIADEQFEKLGLPLRYSCWSVDCNLVYVCGDTYKFLEFKLNKTNDKRQTMNTAWTVNSISFEFKNSEDAKYTWEELERQLHAELLTESIKSLNERIEKLNQDKRKLEGCVKIDRAKLAKLLDEER